ncbi:arginine N-methyltransferase 2 [Eremomyces bilateralis CBS 781.70]|uniref:Arginine N-methyltransferase 2 n=1 Tax=Eremomyces bilateralis CBS 781.70 TaxID=1392243 RepID=A0A6G1FUE6_9PEZI|nr:arginine N-methyltransferase 2 [Eremomyces bilateralis CBS 781.70]KAF1809383.1 arginine N-methyltransferase 2 [Eremomyces bilateralis CBS 781.70]
MEELEEPDLDIQTQMILLASANHDLETLRTLFKTASANVQDEETLVTPLHAAIAACEDDSPDGTANGHGHSNTDVDSSAAPEHGESSPAAKTLRLLFQNGAVWNDLDANNETPGCMAWRLGLKDLYEIIIDAGVRAELLLNRLDEYQMLLGADDDDEDDEEEDEVVEAEVDGEVPDGVTSISLQDSVNPSSNNEAYLSSQIPSATTTTNLLDSSSNAIMMTWETPIMEEHAKELLPREGMRVLNIGHGLGIFDGIVQKYRPASHHIIEAHPDVVERMKAAGWCSESENENARPGVTVHQGRWQDVVPQLVSDIQDGREQKFDAIYFDTFAESYSDFKKFIGLVQDLLASGGKFSMFWGAGADRRSSYDVYTKILEMDLFEEGFDVTWQSIPIPDLQQAGEWEGITRPYWTLNVYKLPTCTLAD